MTVRTKLRVLLVEPDNQLREIFTEYLAQEGVEVIPVEELGMAWPLLQATAPDVAVVANPWPPGRVLPAPEGFWWQKRLRKVPLVLLLTFPQPEVVTQFEAAEVLLKPFSLRQLVQAICRCVA